MICCFNEWIARSNLKAYVGITTSRVHLIKFLFEKGLLDKRVNPNYKNGTQYKISIKGLKYCKSYSEMVGLIKWVGNLNILYVGIV